MLCFFCSNFFFSSNNCCFLFLLFLTLDINIHTSINITKTSITEFEGIDIAVGINNFNQLNNFLNNENEQMNYDFLMIDIDSPEALKGFDMEKAKINYFITAFDAYSLKKGLEIFT